MTLDPELLEKVRKTAADLTEAERQALLARAEYHTAIRRLHLAGGPLREIAQALAGGALTRAPKGSRERCSFCGKRPDEHRSLVTGPAAHICSECMRISREFMSDHAA
jgi:hypothetical protein